MPQRKSSLTGKPLVAAQYQAPASVAAELARTTGIDTASDHNISATLEPQRLAALVRKANRGDAISQFLLAEEMEERFLQYAAVLSTRKIAVSQRPVIVNANGAKPEHVELIKHLSKQPEFGEMKGEALDAIGKGTSFVHLNWDTNAQYQGRTLWLPGGPRHTPEYPWVDPRHFIWHNHAWHQRVKDSSGQNAKPKPIKRDHYIIHRAKLKSGLPLRDGTARLCLAYYMVLNYTLKDWLAFAEVYGLPLRIGKHHAGANAEQINTLLRAVAGLGTDAAAVIPRGMEIEVLNGVTASGTGLFKELCTYVDEQISKAVLGQTMTTDNGSSHSQATVHNEVRKDLRDDDSLKLSHTLNRDLVIPVINHNYGPQQHYPQICLDCSEPGNTKEFAEATSKAVQVGTKIKQNEMRRGLGLDDLPDAEGQQYVQPPAAAAATPAEPQTNTAQTSTNQSNCPSCADAQLNASQAAAQQEEDTLALAGYENWQPQLEPELNAIFALVETIAKNGGNETDLLDQLPQALNKINPDALATRLALQQFKAYAQGSENS